MKKVLLSLTAALGLSGCASTYHVDSMNAPSSQLRHAAGFYVMLPENGRYGSIDYKESGEQTEQEVASALSQHTDRVVAAKSIQPLAAALAEARRSHLNYVFETMILHWEDRATEWSGLPDRITIKYAVYDVRTGKVITSSVTSAKSKWATFGGDHPQDLLPEPTGQFVGQLF